MVVQFCFSSAFFSAQKVINFFPFANFLNKIEKPKCKALFRKMLKGCSCYIAISNIRHSKLKGFQKYIITKLSLFHLHISLWQNYFAFLLLFSWESCHFLFFFSHFLNKIVKPKSETLFIKLLKCYICYILLI